NPLCGGLSAVGTKRYAGIPVRSREPHTRREALPGGESIGVDQVKSASFSGTGTSSASTSGAASSTFGACASVQAANFFFSELSARFAGGRGYRDPLLAGAMREAAERRNWRRVRGVVSNSAARVVVVCMVIIPSV